MPVFTYTNRTPTATQMTTTDSVGTSPTYNLYSVGPIDLQIGDLVIALAELTVTRPMPGDTTGPSPWLWYYQTPNPPRWEGQFAEDHNPAVISSQIVRTTSPTSTTAEFGLNKWTSNNILQYQHHWGYERSAMEAVTKDLPGRYYSILAKASHSKPNAPAGTAVRVNTDGQLQVIVIRGV